MNESPTPQLPSDPQPMAQNSPTKRKKTVLIIAIVAAVVVVVIGFLVKQEIDAKSRAQATEAVSAYDKSTPGALNELNAAISSANLLSPEGVDKATKALANRPKLAPVSGVGVDHDAYKKARERDQKVDALYDSTAATLKDEFKPYVSYAAAIKDLGKAREQAAAEINASGGGIQGAVNAIRTKSIPTIQTSLDAFEKTAKPKSATSLTVLVTQTHKDFIGGLEAFAKELEQGSPQNHDFSAQIAQIDRDLQALNALMVQKQADLKSQIAAIQKQSN